MKHSKRKESRELRRRQREELRAKSVGVGISIPSAGRFSSGTAGLNQKIVFADNEIEENLQMDEKEEDVEKRQTDSEGSDDDDDDDEVEQMESSVARNMALQQREQERVTAQMAAALHSRRRKKSVKKNEEDASEGVVSENTDDDDDEKDEEAEDEEELDEDFFAKVDSEMTEKKRSKKYEEKKGKNKQSGRHTTFVTSEDDVANIGSSPVEVSRNVELVVLGDAGGEDEYPTNNSGTAGFDRMELAFESQIDNNPPSNAALTYSRSQLIVDGSYRPSSKQKLKAKRANKSLSHCEGWKRSKKMNRLVLSKARTSKMRAKGVPAAKFVVSKSF